MEKTNTKRGRPPIVDSHVVINMIINNKHAILREDGGIVSKSSEVWRNMSKELNYLKDARALYTFVTCNKFNIRDKLSGNESEGVLDDNTATNSAAPVEISCSSLEDSSHEEGDVFFDIHIPTLEIEKLLVTKVYTRKKAKKGPAVREYTKFRPGEWQDLLSRKIWAKTHSECGYNFKSHFISQDGTSGHMAGQCNCGSNIKCFLQSDGSDITTIKCVTTKGNGKCGKRYLRAPIRPAVAQELCQKSVYVYRAEKAEVLMREGDPEPAILPNASVLRNAKHEYAASLFLDRDPIKALNLMQLHAMKHVIHNIGLSPFYVMYSTNHQHSIYRAYSKRENACVAIDATGSILKPIIQPDKSRSKAIFLYMCVIRSDFEGQLAVAQMLSERHHTNAISFWLREWVEKPGLPPPKEVVCDASKALLTAAIRAFTNYSTINQYADACNGELMPSCYIRIDVAHYIKIYADFLKQIRLEVKKFYLACIGQLILTTSLVQARKIIHAILVVARSSTEGILSNGELSPCEEEKNYLTDLLTSGEDKDMMSMINTDEHDDKPTDDDEDEEIVGSVYEMDLLETENKWYEWAQEINDSVLQKVASKGHRINAHYFPELASRLLRELRTLPLWSCVCRDKFGYGRIPASSAPVESEFKNIKVHLLRGETLPMRVDQFTAKHIAHINGVTKLADAAAAAKIPAIMPSNHDTICSQNINHEQQRKDSECPACANGDKPTGAHACFVCRTAVHAIELCSSPYEDDEEGYGQRRICNSCQTQGNVSNIVASRQFENWGGLFKPNKQKTQGRYLKEKYGENEFLLDDNIRKIPVLKNGGSVTLKSVVLGKENFTLENTCAFDSVFHIFLSAASYLPSFRTWIQEHCLEDNFFRMVHTVLSKGIKTSSYRLRCEILSTIYAKSSQRLNCTLLRCEITVADLCRKIFRPKPSFWEETICDAYCSKKLNELPILMITLAALLHETYNNQIEKEISLTAIQECRTPGCTGTLKKILNAPGNFVIFEVVPEEGITDDNPVMLREIPTTLQLSFMSEQYMLAGVIHFKRPSVETRSSDSALIKSVGHYTALSYRRGTWIEFDDTKEAAKRRSNKRKVALHLVVFVR